MPRRAMWKGKSVWNLTVDDVSDIIDTLNLKEKIEYHDFDAKGAIPGHNILYWRWSWARNPRFLSNCEANYVLPHYFEKAYAGVPTFVSKFAYDINGHRIIGRFSIHIHTSVPAKLIPSMKDKVNLIEDEFKEIYSWNLLNHTFDYDKWKRDHGHRYPTVINGPGITAAGVIT